jgi:hypothetical protein
MAFSDVVAAAGSDVPLDMVASRDEDAERHAAELGRPETTAWMLSFEKFLSATAFAGDMREMLAALETAYRHPVDIEFTANIVDDGSLRIDLLQCRPFQVRTSTGQASGNAENSRGTVIIRTSGPIIGPPFYGPIDRIIYIVPPAYSSLSEPQQYAVARLIGTLTHLDAGRPLPSLMLIGPGRWGTTTPSLGVPVSFSEINTVKVLCEVAVMHEGLVPDVSLGTHFFNVLVEVDMLYCAVYPERGGSVFDAAFFEGRDSLLPRLVPGSGAFEQVIRVIDPAEHALYLHAEPLEQRSVLFVRDAAAAGQTGGSGI